jgi:cell shape-determining protein MreC
VGQVVQVRRKDVDVFQEAIIEPAADMKQLERLYILMGSTTTRGDGAR